MTAIQEAIGGAARRSSTRQTLAVRGKSASTILADQLLAFIPTFAAVSGRRLDERRAATVDAAKFGAIVGPVSTDYVLVHRDELT